MIHRSSSFIDAKKCLRKHHYKYDLGLIPVKEGEKSVDLAFGSLVHDAAEISANENLNEALSFIDSSQIPPDRVKTPEVAKALLKMFNSTNKTKIVVPERNFFFEGTNFTWKGRHDGIGSYNDLLYVVEYKTTNPWYLQMSPSDQFTSYYIGAKQTFPNLEGMIIVNLDPAKVEVHYHLLRFTEEYCKEWLDEVETFTNYMKICEVMEVFPKSDFACSLYGRQCPYKVLCSDPSPSTVSMLMSKCFKEDQTLLEKAW